MHRNFRTLDQLASHLMVAGREEVLAVPTIAYQVMKI